MSKGTASSPGLRFVDDDNVVGGWGTLTDVLFKLAYLQIPKNVLHALTDVQVVSLIRGEVAARCCAMRAYDKYGQWKTAVQRGLAPSAFVGDPSTMVSRRYDPDLMEVVTVVKTRKRTPVAERGAKDFREYWLQRYVQDNYRRLGFSACEGPFDSGPDFRLRRKGKWHWVEVENTPQRYFQHGHDLDPRWNKVTFLVVLSDEDLRAEDRKRLPATIVIQRAHYDAWAREAMGEYAEKKEAERPAYVYMQHCAEVAYIMKAIVLETCVSTNKDMAVCPDCNACPYFGEGTIGSASGYFLGLANEFMRWAKGRVGYRRLVEFFDAAYDWNLSGCSIGGLVVPRGGIQSDEEG